tara:strand:+ start:546 stop:713 length:168 start_codon:yes stop_codon:yes gene_type:complete
MPFFSKGNTCTTYIENIENRYDKYYPKEKNPSSRARVTESMEGLENENRQEQEQQ